MNGLTPAHDDWCNLPDDFNSWYIYEFVYFTLKKKKFCINISRLIKTHVSNTMTQEEERNKNKKIK